MWREVRALPTTSGNGAETTGGLSIPCTVASAAFSFDHDPLRCAPDRRPGTAALPPSDTNVRREVSGK